MSESQDESDVYVEVASVHDQDENRSHDEADSAASDADTSSVSKPVSTMTPKARSTTRTSSPLSCRSGLRCVCRSPWFLDLTEDRCVGLQPAAACRDSRVI